MLTHAHYRRRWGTDVPEASIASRFLEEVPSHLLQDLGSRRRTHYESRDSDSGYNYEDEDQRPRYERGRGQRQAAGSHRSGGAGQGLPAYNSIDNIAEFFISQGKKFPLSPPRPVEAPTQARDFRPGQHVRHPKYGEGIVYRREGDGDGAKITVQFQRFGLKKLVEKYAHLERA